MIIALKIVSYIGLGLTLIPAFLVFAGRLTWNTHAILMIIGTLLWFLTAPLWIKEK